MAGGCIDLAPTVARLELRVPPDGVHVSTLVAFVEAGLGVAAVPRLSMPRKGHAALVSVPIIEPEVTRTVGLIKRRGRSLSPAAEHLYQMLRAVAAKAQRTSPDRGIKNDTGSRTRSRRTTVAQ